MDDRYHRFILKIIEQTRANIIKWDSLLAIGHAYDEAYLEDFEWLIVQNEYHSVDYTASYMGVADNIFMLLLQETFRSETHDKAIERLNLYFASNKNSDPYTLPVESADLEELKKAISIIVSRKNHYRADDFINDYLDDPKG